MLCPLCAKENKEGARFCGNCGGSLVQGSASDLLDDVLGLGGGSASSPGELNEVGLDDLFQNLSARQSAPAAAPPPPPAPKPSPFIESAAPPPRNVSAARALSRPSPPPAAPPAKAPSSGRLTAESIIASVPETAINPPTTAEEARLRASPAEAPPTPPPPAPPAEEPRAPEAETRRGKREGRQIAVKTAGAPPPLTPLTFGEAPSGWRRALAILSALAMLALLGEVGRHMALANLFATAIAGGGAFVMLVLTLVASGSFDSRHVGKTALLGIVSLTLWAYGNAATPAPVVKHIFLEFEAPLVINGVLALVFLLAGLSLGSSQALPKGARYALGLIALLSTVTLIEALVLQRPFAKVLDGSGLASKLPGSLAYLEPCWVGLNAVLSLAIVVAFFDLMRGLRERQWAVVISTVLSLAIFYRVGQFGIPAFEAAGRPGLRAAVAQADALLRQQASSRGFALPVVVPEPAARPAAREGAAAGSAPPVAGREPAPAPLPSPTATDRAPSPVPVPAASTPSSP